MIEAAYANIGSANFWKQMPVVLGIESGGTRTRRLHESLRNRQREAAALEARA